MQTITENNAAEILGPIFEKAKIVDEFEFCCALARVRGIESAGWDPLRESYDLSQQLIGLIEAPLDSKLKIRLLMFCYCHLTEMDDLYNINANMLRIIMGERYSISPFSMIPKHKGKFPTGYLLNHKIDQLVSLSMDAGFEILGELFSLMFVRPVRNAFYHSDYILTDDSFNIKAGEGVNIEGIIRSKIPLEWLLPKINIGINTAFATIDLLVYHRRLYKEDKIVRGRLAPDGSLIDIQITTDKEKGLTGFKSPPDKKD